MEKRSLAAVYFERLQEDARKVKKRPELLETYNWAKSQYKPLSSELHGFGGGEKILSMAAAEANKEQAMLRQIFGENINIDLKQPGAIKELTETINDVFKFRSIYERNKALITNEKFAGQKGVFSYFHTYFKQALEAALPTILKDIEKRMLANRSLKTGQAAKEAFQAAIPKLTDDAIERMFSNAGTELVSMDPKHKEAYKEIVEAVRDFGNGSIIAQQLRQAWKIDEITDVFSAEFSKTQRRKPKKGTMERAKNAAIKQMSQAMYSKGGLSLEAVIDQCLGMTADKLNGINNGSIITSVQAGVYTGAGEIKARADNVFYFGINRASIDAAFQKVKDSDSDRKATVDAFSQLGKEINEVKDGFIVYFNDKNYTLNDNFLRRKGMSAGTAWTLEQVQDILAGVVNNIDQIIYNILQNGAGAIYAGDTQNTSKVLAEGIAYYLFDDYTTIGNSEGNAIHIMGLQGMLIPLSAFLYALGTAIQSVENNPNSYVHINISAPAVDDSDKASYYMENWVRQYEASMEKTKISIHFMENFIGFVKGYL